MFHTEATSVSLFCGEMFPNQLTLSDKGFFGLQKYEMLFAHRVHKNIQNYESIQASQLMTS